MYYKKTKKMNCNKSVRIIFIAAVFFIAACKDQNQLNNELQIAVLNNNLGATIKALRSGADANFRRTLDAPLLVTAIANKNDDIAVQLIQYNANIEEKISQEESLFLVAVRQGLTQTVKALLQKNIDIDQKNNKGENALIIAAKNKNSEIALELIKKNIYVYAADKQGGNALFWATINRDLETAKYIQGFNKEINTAVVLINFNNVAELEKQSTSWQYMNLNSRDFWNRTLLVNACFLNKPEVVKWLMQKNVNKDIKDYFNLTAKDYAVQLKNQRIINLLEGKDEIVETKSTQQITPSVTQAQNQTTATQTNTNTNTASVGQTTAVKTKTQEELDREEFERKKKIMEALKEKEDSSKTNTVISNDYDE